MTITNQLEEHEIYETVSILLDKILTVEDEIASIEDLNDYGLKSFSRLQLIIKTTEKKLNSNDPLLFSVTNLEKLNNELKALYALIKGHPNLFINTAELNQLNNRLNNVSLEMSVIPTIIDEDSINDIRDVSTSFKRSLAQQKSHLDREFNDLKSNLKSLHEKSKVNENTIKQQVINNNEEIKKLQNQYVEFQNLFTSSQEAHSQEFIKEMRSISGKHQQLYNSQSSEFQKNINSFNSELDKMKTDYQEEHQYFLEDRNQKNDEYDKIFEEHLDSVEDLVGKISTNSIAGHYKNVADTHKNKTYIWQALTLLSFISTIIIGFTLFVYQDNALNWMDLVGKIVVTSALGSLIAYTTRQAAKNEEQEKVNRSMEVDLKTLNPYLASLSGQDQITLKKNLFPVIFANKTQINEEDEEVHKK